MLVYFLWLEVSLCHLCRKGDKQPIETVVGKHVITVEGIGNSENPHPLQERMAKLHGSQ
jgi:xanthine dehydrogenase/oxidase